MYAEGANVFTSLPTLVFFVILATLTHVEWYLPVVLISLMTNDTEHLFMCLLGAISPAGLLRAPSSGVTWTSALHTGCV